MKNMKGVTLLETVVVIAIIAILSLFGVNTINSFKSDANLDNMTNELISQIRVARSKSMNGEILTGENEGNFGKDGLPDYGINILTHGYELVRKYVKGNGSAVNNECFIADGALCEKISLDDDFSLVPEGSFYFDRITGNFSGITIALKEKGVIKRNIIISKDFVITVENK